MCDEHFEDDLAKYMNTTMSRRRFGALSAGIGMAMLLPALLLALAVAPLLSQMAPRDSLTAETNQRLGRVVALVSPVPDPSAREHIRALPGVLAVSAPSEGPNPRYRFDCQAFKTLLAQRPCDQPLDLPPRRRHGALGDGVLVPRGRHGGRGPLRPRAALPGRGDGLPLRVRFGAAASTRSEQGRTVGLPVP